MKEEIYKYLVGIWCPTFNQSKYILDALNGFVMQQTNFPFVVMVVDDASTDGEQEVIRKFVAEQFDLADTNVAYEKETDYAYITYAQHKTNKNCYIVAMYLKMNHYSQKKNKYQYFTQWRSNAKYEAICEGDDYWIDSLKLQKQVDILEVNPKLSSCWTGYISRQNGLADKDMTIKCLDKKNLTIYTLNEWKNIWFTKTLTALIRLEALEEYTNKQETFSYARDIHQFYYILKWGNAAYMHSITAVYNVHEGGICSMVANSDNAVHNYNCFKELYRLEHDEILRCCYLASINGRLKYRKKNQHSVKLMREGLIISINFIERIRIIFNFLFNK